MAALQLKGNIRLSEAGQPRRTKGEFADWMLDNSSTLGKYFGEDLFPGSLNIDVLHPANLLQDLDGGNYPPAFVIPKTKLVTMASYIKDGQAWRATISGAKFPKPARCWVFRRIGSRVPPGVLEILATISLVQTYGLQHGDEVTLSIEFVV